MVHDEADEDVVLVVGFRIRKRFLQGVRIVRSQGGIGRQRLSQIGCWLWTTLSVVSTLGLHPLTGQVADHEGVLGVHHGDGPSVGASLFIVCDHRLRVRCVPIHRRRMKEVEHEDHDPDQQDEELHGDLQQAVHQQPAPCLLHRLPSEVALHLALVRAEVGELQEEAADQAAPQRVLRGRIPRGVDHIQFAQGIGELQAFAEGNGIAQLMHDEAERHEEPGEHHCHLLFVRYTHGLRTSSGGVHDHQSAYERAGPAERPMQHLAQHNAGRVNGETRGKAALDQEEDSRQQAGALIEALANELVRRVHVPLVVQGNEHVRDHHHSQRQTEVELHEAHAFHESLAGCT